MKSKLPNWNAYPRVVIMIHGLELVMPAGVRTPVLMKKPICIWSDEYTHTAPTWCANNQSIDPAIERMRQCASSKSR